MAESSQPVRERKIPIGMIVLYTMAAAVMTSLIFAYLGQDGATEAIVPKIDRYGMITDFSLVDHHNQPFTQKDVAGKIWVANFIFTSCATECPLISRRMRDIQAAFADDPRVELVSISIDPRTDNPERLAKYAKAFDAGEKWFFLTGDSEEIKNLVMKGFLVVHPDGTPDAISNRRNRELLHSEKIAVVDELGVVRFFANGMDPKASQQVASAVRQLLVASE